MLLQRVHELAVGERQLSIRQLADWVVEVPDRNTGYFFEPEKQFMDSLFMHRSIAVHKQAVHELIICKGTALRLSFPRRNDHYWIALRKIFQLNINQCHDLGFLHQSCHVDNFCRRQQINIWH